MAEEPFFKLESFANFFERENAEKIFDFNYCLLNANSTRKEVSNKKKKQAEPILKCLNDKLTDNILELTEFRMWGSVPNMMANEYSDIDFVIWEVNDHLDKIDEIALECGFKENENNTLDTAHVCNIYKSYEYEGNLKIDLSIQLCNKASNYDYHCMKHTTEFQKDMIWCLNQELKLFKPKQKLWEKTINLDTIAYFKNVGCDFMTKTKI